MPRKVKVYIASPYSNGDKESLVELHMTAAYHLLKMGFNPFAPLYNHFIQIHHPDVDTGFDWLEVDKAWLADCDILIRLHPKNKKGEPIPSPGADEEERYAGELGIPVFHFDTLEELVRTMSTFATTV